MPAVTALGMLLLATACGGSEPQAATGPSPAPSASPSAELSPSPMASTAPSPEATTSNILLTGNGIEASRGLVEFGAGFDEVSAALEKGLGTPTADSGLIPSSDVGVCPAPDLRLLTYAGGLQVVFGSDAGKLSMLYWQVLEDGADVPAASALVGDVTTFEFGIGTTVRQLREGAGEAFEAFPADEALGARFFLRDQSPGFSGELSGTSDSDTVTALEAGELCGE